MDGNIANQPILISYTIDLDDVAVLTAHSEMRRRRFGISYAIWKRAFKILVMLAALFACWQIYSNVTGYLNGEGLRPEGWVLTAALALVILSRLPFVKRWWIKRSSDARQKLPQDIQLQIDDSGVGGRSNFSTSHVLWTGFVNADETKDYFLLYQARLHAVVIPKRAIAGESQISDLRNMIRTHINDFTEYKV